MATLTPVDHDPFGASTPDGVGANGVLRLTVRPSRQGPKLTPVDHDPFETPSTAGGLYKAVDAGVASGIAGLVGLPEAIAGLGGKGIAKATNYIEDKFGLGRSDFSHLDRPGRLPTTAGAQKAIQDEFYGGAAPYQPQGRLEEYARTVGEFAPAALATPGGVVAKAAQAIIPAVASETAGQVTKGSDLEPWARGGAAVVAGGLTSLAQRPGTAARALREQLPPGVSVQMVDDAERLIQDAARQGIDLAWPEALSQVAGRPVLTNTMRHLEAAPQTEGRMAEFFGARPQQVEIAARQQFDNIAPVNQNPSGIGPAVGAAADDAIGTVRRSINDLTEADYAAAAAHRLSPQEMTRVRALPGFEEAAAAVRGDPQLNRYVANLPDDSVGFLNEVKKQLDQMGANARAPMAQNQNMQRAAGLEMDAGAVRDAGTRASPDYARALLTQQGLREQFLEPLLQGPLGKIAQRDQTTKAAIDALFPANPLANSAQEIGQTVGVLAARNPRAAADLVRAHVEGTFNEAAQALQSGANQAGGAKFRAVLVGNPQQAANLEAAVTALPNGAQRWEGFNRLLEILEATGTRMNPGSRTAYNAEMLKSQAASGIAGETAKAATNPLRVLAPIAEKYERYRLGQNLNELADILTNPGSANQLRAIARMPPGSQTAQNTVARVLAAANSSRTPRVSGPGVQAGNE